MSINVMEGEKVAEQEAANKPVGAFDLFGKSVEVVKRNLNNFVILNLLPFMGGVLSMFSKDSTDSPLSSASTFTGVPSYFWGIVGLGIVLALLFFIVSIIIQAMLTALQLEGAKGRTPSLKNLWATAKKYWFRLFGLELLVGIMVVAGLILLIVPGLIMIRRYLLAPYFLVEKDLRITEAMRQSAELSKPYANSIWGIIGVMILLSLIGIIPVVGWFVSFILMVLYSVAPALRYEELKRLTPQSST